MSILYLIDPPSDVERAIFQLDAIGLAAAEKFDGIRVDERHVSQIQYQLLARCLDGEGLFKLLDILRRFDPAAEGEDNSTIPRSPGPQHASSPGLKTGDAAGGISFSEPGCIKDGWKKSKSMANRKSLTTKSQSLSTMSEFSSMTKFRSEPALIASPTHLAARERSI
jgi:hypothetical protein